MSYKNEVLASLPLAYWRLGDASGATLAKDEVGLNPGSYGAGVLLGKTGLLVDDQDTAVQFNGSSTVSIPDFPLPTTELSIEAWVIPNDLSGQRTVLGQDTSVSGDLSVFFFKVSTAGDKKFRFVVRNPSGGVGEAVGTALVAIQTYHLVATYDGATIKLYVNGALDAQAPYTGGFTTPTGPFAIGAGYFANALSDFSAATVDEVAIYPRALTENEIRRHYWAGKGKSGYELEVLASGPEAFWRLDELAGSVTAADASGNGNDAPYVGGPILESTPLAELSGTAIALDGVDDRIETTVTLPATGDFSVEAWVRTTAIIGEVISNNKGEVGRFDFGINQDATGETSGRLKLFVGGTPSFILVSSGVINDGLDHHVVGTREGSTFRIFIDGQQVNSGAYSQSIVANNLFIGVDPNLSRFFAGKLDEPSVYSRALTPTEIRRHYYRGKGEVGYKLEVLSSGPEAYWRLGETSGTVAVDASGNGHDGTYVSTPTLGQDALILDQNKSVYFDGGNNVDTNVSTNNWPKATLEVWIKADAAPVLGQFSMPAGSDALAVSWDHQTDPNALGVAQIFTTSGKFYQASFGGLSVPVVYNLVITWDGQVLKTYKNGILIASTAAVETALHPTNNPFLIAKQPSFGTGWPGVVDEVSLYKTALSAEEILRHYAVGKYGAAAALFRLAGLITADGAAAEVLVRAFRWDTGELLGEVTSDPGDGSYEISGLTYDGELLVVTQPDAGLRPLAHGPVTPEQQS